MLHRIPLDVLDTHIFQLLEPLDIIRFKRCSKVTQSIVRESNKLPYCLKWRGADVAYFDDCKRKKIGIYAPGGIVERTIELMRQNRKQKSHADLHMNKKSAVLDTRRHLVRLHSKAQPAPAQKEKDESKAEVSNEPPEAKGKLILVIFEDILEISVKLEPTSSYTGEDLLSAIENAGPIAQRAVQMMQPPPDAGEELYVKVNETVQPLVSLGLSWDALPESIVISTGESQMAKLERVLNEKRMRAARSKSGDSDNSDPPPQKEPSDPPPKKETSDPPAKEPPSLVQQDVEMLNVEWVPGLSLADYRQSQNLLDDQKTLKRLNFGRTLRGVGKKAKGTTFARTLGAKTSFLKEALIRHHRHGMGSYKAGSGDPDLGLRDICGTGMKNVIQLYARKIQGKNLGILDKFAEAHQDQWAEKVSEKDYGKKLTFWIQSQNA